MKAPANFDELIRYLTAYPDVRRKCTDLRSTNMGLAQFKRYEDGLMWFQSHLGGPESHMPVECGLTSGETGIEYFDDHFSFIKFGVRVDVYYMPGPDLQQKIGG